MHNTEVFIPPVQLSENLWLLVLNKEVKAAYFLLIKKQYALKLDFQYSTIPCEQHLWLLKLQKHRRQIFHCLCNCQHSQTTSFTSWSIFFGLIPHKVATKVRNDLRRDRLRSKSKLNFRFIQNQMLARFLQMLSKAPICLHRHPACKLSYSLWLKNKHRDCLIINKFPSIRDPLCSISVPSVEKIRKASKSAKNSALRNYPKATSIRTHLKGCSTPGTSPNCALLLPFISNGLDFLFLSAEATYVPLQTFSHSHGFKETINFSNIYLPM